jgi:predicted phosphodiesterase
MPIEFVVHTGDLASQPMENRLFIDSVLAMMHACKYPVYYLPGNHDISFKRFQQTSEAFIRNFGNLCRRIEVHGVSMITLFNFKIWDANGRTIYNPLTQLDSLLKDKPTKMSAIIFQHDPIINDFYNNAFQPGWPPEDRIAFQTLCETNTIIAVIAGHFHRDEFHWLGQIPLYISAPVSGKRGRQATFRVYHYKNGKLSYFSQYL